MEDTVAPKMLKKMETFRAGLKEVKKLLGTADEGAAKTIKKKGVIK